MAEMKFYVQHPDSGNTYGPMTAGDRGNYVSRGYKDVTEQHSSDDQSSQGGQPQAQQAPRQPQPSRPAARTAPSQQPTASGEQPPAP